MLMSATLGFMLTAFIIQTNEVSMEPKVTDTTT